MKGGPEHVKKSLTYGWFSYVSWVSLAGIGPLLLTVGTDDSLYPDTPLLRERALAEGVDLEFIEKEGLAHLFMFAPIPEAKPVIDRFVERIKHAAVCSS
jgi:acetyl esterase/lipase